MKTTKNTITIEQALKASNSSKNQNIKEKFVDKHVYCNVGTLCEYVLSKGFEDNDAPFTIDDIENYYSYPEYKGEYASFNGGDGDQKDEEIERLKELLTETENETPQPGKEQDQQDKIGTIENEIGELDALETEAQEIYEWWAVSSHLYDKLKELGYCVVDAGSCKVWGRCTTGQAILLDYAISKICADMEILEGQANSWA